MPAKGTISKYLSPYRIISMPLYRKFVKDRGSDMDGKTFMEIADTMTEVIRDFIENDVEGVKLPYFGLLIPYRTRVTQKLKESYINRAPEKRKQIRFRAYFGKVAWVRFRVSRFPFSKAYSFIPCRELARSVKDKANSKHAYQTCVNIKSIHQFGKLLLCLDDSITKNLLRK